MMRSIRIHKQVLLAAAMWFASGCGGAGHLEIPEPIPTDMRDIPPPKRSKIYLEADAFDKTVARPFQRAFDLSRQLRKLTGNKKEALNVNAFDEVRDSSWFTNRNAQQRMSVEAIERGPNKIDGPNLEGSWTIIAAKSEGVTPGFTIEDSDGERFVIKFDPPHYEEMATGAEMVSTKIFYAAGYNTPENYLVYFRPDILRLGDKVLLRDESGKKRAMNHEDLKAILNRISLRDDGSIRAVASRFLTGKVLGPFRYHGTRKDDPNDFIPHEHRRELRGLRVVAAWLNHYDTKAHNSLDVYVDSQGRHFVRHYLIDFGSTLGSQGDEPMPLWTGHEETFDPSITFLNTLALGTRVPKYQLNRPIRYSSIGRFDAVGFEPQSYKFIIPNPAFVNLTDRDGYWGAKIVMSFTDEQLAAAVKAGGYSNPEAAAYLLGVLKERRDIVGHYWFEKVNSLDRFELDTASEGTSLRFVDLAVETGLATASTKDYECQIWHDDRALSDPVNLEGQTSVALPSVSSGILDVRLRDRKPNSNHWSKWLSVYVGADANPGYSLIAVKRRD